MLYGNASGENTRTVRLFAGMFGLAVMAAAVPGVAEDVVHEGFEGAHFAMANAFAIAYVATRFAAAGAWKRGMVVTDWPIAQHLGGAVPWLVSVWVDEPWKFALWALGIAIDLVTLVLLSGDDLLGEAQKRIDALTRRSPERMETFAGLKIVRFDSGHLSERLSLFVIIVLGEGVIQCVDAASEAEWDQHLFPTGAAAFLLLAGMWGLSVVYGYAGVPHLRADTVPRRLALALHCGTTASIAAVAAGLGGAVAHGGEHIESPQRWLLCGAIAGYFLLGMIANVVSSGLTVGRPVLWGTSGVAVPLLIGVYGDELTGTGSGDLPRAGGPGHDRSGAPTAASIRLDREARAGSPPGSP